MTRSNGQDSHRWTRIWAYLALLLAPGLVGCGDQFAPEAPETASLALEEEDDGLSPEFETNGWTILVDFSGFGLGEGDDFGALTEVHVTSDPTMYDTDGDGLGDGEEFLIRTDPRNPDTDGDGLTDGDEWNIYYTSPVSVDSDADARGPGKTTSGTPPNALLFDGAELVQGLSPTHDDTDGDGKTDFEEIDHVFRDPRIADLPRVELEIVGDVDMRLFVEYAEEEGQEQSFGTTLTTARETSRTTSSGTTVEVSAGTSLGFGTSVGQDGKDTVWSVETSAEVEFGTANARTMEFESSSTASIQREVSRERSYSQGRTESSSRGEVRLQMRIHNVSRSITYTMTQLAVAVRQWRDTNDGRGGRRFSTLLTLSLDALTGVTLAPGASTDIVTVLNDDVNPALLREFMANPSSLSFVPVYYDLTDGEDLNFAFLAENAYSQTALIEIDYGDGNPRTERVSAVVERGYGGTFQGISMADALQLLGLSFETGARLRTDPTTGESVMEHYPTRIGHKTEFGEQGEAADQDIHDDDRVLPPPSPRGLWIVGSTNPEHSRPGVDFRTMRLFAGDQIRLSFWEDNDGDTLSGIVERFHGTMDQPLDVDPSSGDTDRDGLADPLEALRGWCAGAPGVTPAEAERFFTIRDIDLADPGDFEVEDGDDVLQAKIAFRDEDGRYPRWVYSNPTTRDGDDDGLNDLEECQAGTDPNNPDTDGDLLPDGSDPQPLRPQIRLYVNANRIGELTPGDTESGRSWARAYRSLQEALDAADAANNDADPENDIGDIWVAQGIYRTTMEADADATFALLSNVAIVGGFQGHELRIGDRNDDPETNGTQLTGPPLATGVRALHVVTCRGIDGARLDGFRIFGGAATAAAQASGGGLFNDGATDLTIANVLFQGNEARRYGAGAYDHDSEVTYIDCTFSGNEVGMTNGGQEPGGGGLAVDHADALATGAVTRLEGCSFVANAGVLRDEEADGGGVGGGMLILQGVASLERCAFRDNIAHRGGGLCVSQDGQAHLVNCAFAKNSTRPTDVLEGLPGYAFYDRLTVERRFQEWRFSSFPDTTLSPTYFVSGAGSIDLIVGAVPGATAGGTVTTDATTQSTTPWVDLELRTTQFPDGWSTLRNELPDWTGSSASRHRIGGGIHNDGELLAVGCTFWRNAAVGGGGIAVGRPTGGSPVTHVLNCTFAQNQAILLASALFVQGPGSGSVVNSIFSGQGEALMDAPAPTVPPNHRPYTHNTTEGSNGSLQLRHGPSGWIALADESTPIELRAESDIMIPSLTDWVVASNLYRVDPVTTPAVPRIDLIGDTLLFGGLDIGDLRLEPGTPAIDQGNSAIDYNPFNGASQDPWPLQDRGEQPRVVGPSIDLGAHENQGS